MRVLLKKFVTILKEKVKIFLQKTQEDFLVERKVLKMSIKENKNLLLRFEQMINTADEKLAEELISADSVFYAPTHSAPLKGAKGYLEIVYMMRGAFSDIQWHVEDSVIEENKIAVCWICTGTHDGNFMNFPASGKKFQVRCMNFYYIENGKFTKDIGTPDLLGIMKQIGVLP